METVNLQELPLSDEPLPLSLEFCSQLSDDEKALWQHYLKDAHLANELSQVLTHLRKRRLSQYQPQLIETVKEKSVGGNVKWQPDPDGLMQQGLFGDPVVLRIGSKKVKPPYAECFNKAWERLGISLKTGLTREQFDQAIHDEQDAGIQVQEVLRHEYVKTVASSANGKDYKIRPTRSFDQLQQMVDTLENKVQFASVYTPSRTMTAEEEEKMHRKTASETRPKRKRKAEQTVEEELPNVRVKFNEMSTRSGGFLADTTLL